MSLMLGSLVIYRRGEVNNLPQYKTIGMALIVTGALSFAFMMYAWLWSPLEEEH
jgi:hypothetical protein